MEAIGDPTAHAEMLCIRSAAAQMGGWRLTVHDSNLIHLYFFGCHENLECMHLMMWAAMVGRTWSSRSGQYYEMM